MSASLYVYACVCRPLMLAHAGGLGLMVERDDVIMLLDSEGEVPREPLRLAHLGVRVRVRGEDEECG